MVAPVGREDDDDVGGVLNDTVWPELKRGVLVVEMVAAAVEGVLMGMVKPVELLLVVVAAGVDVDGAANSVVVEEVVAVVAVGANRFEVVDGVLMGMVVPEDEVVVGGVVGLKKAAFGVVALDPNRFGAPVVPRGCVSVDVVVEPDIPNGLVVVT